MKALVYGKAHALADFDIRLTQVAEPVVRERDLLVEVAAVGINPGETFIRRTRSAEAGGRVLLGWEFAGVVAAVGAGVRGFSPGDRVFGTGDVSRDGAWAEYVAVDHRVVARIPAGVSFGDAASLPVGALTAWEAMARDGETLPPHVSRVVVVGGAGAVGSLGIQLLKALTDTFVIATASRAQSRAWCLRMGADLVVDHGEDVVQQLASHGIAEVDLVLSTAASVSHLGWITKVLRPFGHLGVVDMPVGLEVAALMPKALSLHTEMVFSRILGERAPEEQGQFLARLGGLVEERRVKPIVTTLLKGLSPETMKAAHTMVETGRTVGKVVLEL